MERRASEAKTVRQGIEGKLHSGDDGSTLPEADEQAIAEDDDEDDGASIGDSEDDFDEEDPTEWQPGEGVEVDYAAIVSILVRHLDVQGELHLLNLRSKDFYSTDPLRDRRGDTIDLPSLDRVVPRIRSGNPDPFRAKDHPRHPQVSRSPRPRHPSDC